MTREEFAGILRYLVVASGKPMEKETAEVYFDLLGDLPYERLKNAVREAIKESKYPVIPAVGYLRDLATIVTTEEKLAATARRNRETFGEV